MIGEAFPNVNDRTRYDNQVRNNCDEALAAFDGDVADFTENGKLYCSGSWPIEVRITNFDVNNGPHT